MSADDTAAPEKTSPDDMALPRQKRRMLPKTPVCILLNIWIVIYDQRDCDFVKL